VSLGGILREGGWCGFTTDMENWLGGVESVGKELMMIPLLS